ncbi:BFD domain protein (2Fe-2S)-binding domain protein [Syntrophobotulus glycolicus DSM 8271]|uniref:BFD domain protein (2Fe-2S)-binding domain protein n=1 Tax=Syntrophobotulus glycolicus (strain DSM 8271 / FlGlyR) TaxID=645991 RepID=F0SU52_SYNGF|nr:(2Fe-2S)-binding protein [Syntrophobotulus glycolicus]ADY55435.1 BFD domain protein (2Fe-2S)-binding domain protein [Syntrophobotulus glycolicus DSM 8271]
MKGLTYTGFLSDDEVRALLPSPERMAKGPVAVIECTQNIPCNPCESACPFGAITIGEELTALPVLDQSKCRGCGLCVSGCPGLAIFLVDAAYSETEAAISLPYEYWPLPAAGDLVKGLDRAGHPVTEARIIHVDTLEKNTATAVITLAVLKQFMHEVRSFAPAKEQERREFVCRCEEITAAEIRQAVREGAKTVTDVKLATRAGMGLCQGLTCRKKISQIIAEETGRPLDELFPATVRPPVRPVPLGSLAGGEENE